MLDLLFIDQVIIISETEQTNNMIQFYTQNNKFLTIWRSRYCLQTIILFFFFEKLSYTIQLLIYV